MGEWIYENNKDNSERYLLGQEGEKQLVCIGINSSTAVPENLDPTLTRVQRTSERLGYDGWLMLNVYPQRATNPQDLHSELNQKSHQKNIEAIRTYLNPDKQYDVWGAWGTIIEKRKYLLPCLCDIYQVLAEQSSWFSMGQITKAGHPHHPLYLRADLQLDQFDMKNYLNKFV